MKKSNDPISWMARNPVASNLLMLIFLVGGLVLALTVKQEVFPQFTLDIIHVSVDYPAASPEEVEEGVILAIEDAVRSLDGVKEVTSVSVEGNGTVVIEVLSGVDSSKVLQDVKNEVDRIQSFPEEAEKPVVNIIEVRREVISLIVYGNQDLRTLRTLAEQIRDELLEMDKITLVTITGVPDLEIAVEVPENQLRKYHLTLGEIADLIRRSALNLPAGGVKTPSGEVLLRTEERRDFAKEFENIDVVATNEGTKLKLADIATIKETFEDSDIEATFNGMPAVQIRVFRVGNQTPIETSKIVRSYISKISPTLPPGVYVDPWLDSAEGFKDRMNLLLNNAFYGLILVLLLLGLFLEPRLAFWVTLGIPVSVIGSFLFIPLTGASINMISLFAFIITLGIVVDDAIVVGESIYQKREKGVRFIDAAVEGVNEVVVPVTFAVLTNIAAFIPLLFVPGFTGKFFFQIPAVVIAVLVVSLIESLFVLPAHLSFEHKESKFWTILNKPSLIFDRILDHYIKNNYSSQLKWGLRNRYLTLAGGCALLILSFGLMKSGLVPFTYLPRVDVDIATAQVVLPFGAPIDEARRIQQRLIKAGEETLKELGGVQMSKGTYSLIGEAVGTDDFGRGTVATNKGSHLVGAQIELVSAEKREFSGSEFASKWREATGKLVGIESSTFQAALAPGGGRPIEVDLSHPSTEILELAARDLTKDLGSYKGVTDISSGVTQGKPQLSFKLKPEARGLGMTATDLAQQVRNAFYGSEALRQQRGRNEIKVLVRLPEEERKTFQTVENLILKTQGEGEIPLQEAVDVSIGRSDTSIEHSGGKRVITVSADVDEILTNANEVVSDLELNAIPSLIQKYPGISYTLKGQIQEQNESLESMKVGFPLAMIAIFSLLAIPFRSYIQPIIVMISIPFGIVGAILGHIILGYELSISSLLGIVALSGVVVNDSLVLIVTTNRLREEAGLSSFEALIKAGISRFRPILLTSLTTFFGLMPIIFERSLQARFLIPMAISLGFGVLFATFITLLLIPAIYLVIEDFRPSHPPLPIKLD